MKKYIAALMSALMILAAPCAMAQVRQGDTIAFGRYTQEMPNQEILWRVLYVNGDTAVLLSDRILECMPYDQESNHWVGSDLCWWLNGPFLATAFNYQERWRLLPDENGLYVSIPSRGDLTNPAYGFSASKDAKDARRSAMGTPHALSNGLWASKLGYSTYFLRSTPNDTNVDQIRTTGSVGIARIDRDNVGVRPMIMIYVGGME